MFLSQPVQFWTSVAYENSSTYPQIELDGPWISKSGTAELSLALMHKSAEPSF